MTHFLQAHLQRYSGPIAWVRPAVLLTALLGTAVHAATGTADTGLEQRLIEQGWQASSDDAGNTLLYPPARSAPTTADPVPPVAQTTTTHPPDLQELLRQRGWVIRESAAGTTLQLLLDPPSAPPAPTQEPPPGAGSRAQDVYRMLEERGWRIHQDASGNTLLIPARTAGSPASGSTTTAAGPAGDSLADFRRAAEATGWRIESTADGSLIMRPPGASAVRLDATSTIGTCQGVVTPSVATGSLGLPISNTASARRLAEEWLTDNASVGRAVGRLRQVNRIYVVSIVDDAPPFQLRNQLIIRRDNGRVIPVY